MPILTALGWLVFVSSAGLAVLTIAQAAASVRSHRRRAQSSLVAAPFLACAAFAMAAVLGVISAITGIVLAALAAILAVLLVAEDARKEDPRVTDDDGKPLNRGTWLSLADAVFMAREAAGHAAGATLSRVLPKRAPEPAAGAAAASPLVPDDLAPRRKRNADALPVAAPDDLPPPLGPVRPPRPLPASEEGTPAVTTPPTGPASGAGAAADVLTGVNVLVTHALSGGQQSLERTTLTLTEVAKGIGRALHTLGTRLSEPDQHYGPEVWEKFLAMAAHLQGAAMTGTEASSVVHMVGSTPLREFGASGVTAPHHNKVNSV